ncbi:unnamed protein product, partial [Nesidiocoris tenuis]
MSLSLHGPNDLWSLQGKWGSAASTITNLFLGENHISSLKGLEKFKMLNLLNLDKNQVHDLAPGYLPKTLHTLSLSSNLFSKFPWEYLSSAERIAWLYLRDNFINTLPLYNFKNRKKLDKLDLGENALSEITSIFNGTLQIRDLNLDLNEITSIGDGVFQGTNVGRIYLSQNKISNVSDDAFLGVENTLEYLDLGGNSLQMIPRAVESLRKLKYLYLPSNNISLVHNDTFLGVSETLSALSLSGNDLDHVPSDSLCVCKQLTHLNLGYNRIMEIVEDDFVGLDSLETLLLMNNRVVVLPAHSFRQTPTLRELSLSFNKISAVDEETFVDLESSLESLEISFGLYFEEFPDEYLKPLKALVWLALDNNNFRSIAKSALYPFRNLQYLNLEGNRISKLPSGVFHPLVHRDLKDIRLSYNHLISVEPHTFSNLPELQSIVLSGNQIKTIKPNSFRTLPSKLSVILSDNKIHTISPRAFNDISTLVRLDLQSNDLQEFSLSAFQNVTDPQMPMSLNLSRNHLVTLRIADTRRPVSVHTIDLSRNNLFFVPKDFLEAISQNLLKINLGYNNLNRLDESAFGELSQLQTLSLPHNAIATLRKRAFAGLKKLQILDLSHNQIEQLHMEQFKSLQNLRIVDLSFNHLRSIPRDAFQNTKLERLDISNNEFVIMPSSSLGEVGFTLRVLDASYNMIEHIDSTIFPETPLLTSLNLCYNKLTMLPDGAFKGLTNLIRLELCGNRIRGNHKEMLNFSSELRYLNLGETGVRNLPQLPPFPKLVSLNLSANYLASVASLSVPSLRELHIAGCRLPSLPSWTKLPLLRLLDISNNPIRSADETRFIGKIPRWADNATVRGSTSQILFVLLEKIPKNCPEKIPDNYLRTKRWCRITGQPCVDFATAVGNSDRTAAPDAGRTPEQEAAPHRNHRNQPQTSVADSSLRTATNIRASTSDTGYIHRRASSRIGWLCKKQTSVALSSTEAELVAASTGIQEAIWLRLLLRDMGFEQNSPTLIYEDNQSCIKYIENEKASARIKHLDVRKYYMKDLIKKKEIALEYCPSEDNLADLLTKALPARRLQDLRSRYEIVESADDVEGSPGGGNCLAKEKPKVERGRRGARWPDLFKRRAGQART